MGRIKIVEKDHELDEETLTAYENQGLELIAVNHVRSMEYPVWLGIGTDTKVEKHRWVYHFRILL